MGRCRIYFTKEEKIKKNYLKNKGYFKFYYKYYYLKKKIEELEKAPINKSKKFDEILLTLKNQESRENRKE